MGVTEGATDNPPALFFSLVLAYIIPMFSFITARTREALFDLRPILDMNDNEFSLAEDHLDSSSNISLLLCLTFGIVCGFAHLSLLRGSPVAAAMDMFGSASMLMSATGTIVVWVVMTFVVTKLIQQAILFGRLGRHSVRVTLLNTSNLLPFARVSISASLAIIGALALFPLISIEGGLNVAESVPGVVAMMVPLLVMFIIPVWPVHRRLRAMKSAELAVVNDKIEALVPASAGAPITDEALLKLSPMINYRREIASTPTWPFDVGNVARLMFYLIIPPLTWAGAALIENVVDSML